MQFFQNRDTATCGGELRMEIGLRFAPGQERRGGLRKRGVGQSESTIFSVCFSNFLFCNSCEFPEKLAKMSRSSENILRISKREREKKRDRETAARRRRAEFRPEDASKAAQAAQAAQVARPAGGNAPARCPDCNAAGYRGLFLYNLRHEAAPQPCGYVL